MITSPEPLLSLGTTLLASVLNAMSEPSALGSARNDSSSPPLVVDPGVWLMRCSVEFVRSRKKTSPLPEAVWPGRRSLALLVNEIVFPSSETFAPKLLAFALAEIGDDALREIKVFVLLVRSQTKTSSTLLRSLETRSGAVL